MSNGRFTDIINEARRPQGQEAGKEEGKVDTPEPEVNLCVKVPVSLRRHWAAEAKRQGVTMTGVIVAALERRFGKPE